MKRHYETAVSFIGGMDAEFDVVVRALTRCTAAPSVLVVPKAIVINKYLTEVRPGRSELGPMVLRQYCEQHQPDIFSRQSKILYITPARSGCEFPSVFLQQVPNITKVVDRHGCVVVHHYGWPCRRRSDWIVSQFAQLDGLESDLPRAGNTGVYGYLVHRTGFLLGAIPVLLPGCPRWRAGGRRMRRRPERPPRWSTSSQILACHLTFM